MSYVVLSLYGCQCTKKDQRFWFTSPDIKKAIATCISNSDWLDKRSVPCGVQHAYFGANNAVYDIELDDGTHYAIRFPLQSYQYGTCLLCKVGESHLARLENEALTLEHLNSHVPGIPVPHAYKYGSTFDKEIGLPFILMD